jgi:hypothetical protein
MAYSTSIYWFNGPEAFSQRLSITADALAGKAVDIVATTVEHAAKRMEDIIQEGGIEPTKKGGPRIKSSAMIDSVDSDSKINGRGRAQGEFGFSDNTPMWTTFQERGTLGGGGKNKGIAPMRAYETARQEANVEFQNLGQKTKWLMYKEGSM